MQIGVFSYICLHILVITEHFTIFAGCIPLVFSEHSVEVLDRGKSAIPGDLGDTPVTVLQFPFHIQKPDVVQIFGKGGARQLLELSAEIKFTYSGTLTRLVERDL